MSDVVENKKNSLFQAEMFNNLVKDYDFLNHFLSLNRDTVWRKALANRLNCKENGAGFKLLDLAAGTGDQIVELKKTWPQLSITGVDIAQSMLDVAEKKIKKLPSPKVNLLIGDALDLEFDDNFFDAVSISFALRNIFQRDKLYQEVLRVLKPGGQFLILEMFFDECTLWSKFYYWYLNFILPKIASLFSSKKKTYYYLAASIMNFPQPLQIKSELALHGFKDVRHENFTFNSVMLVCAHK